MKVPGTVGIRFHELMSGFVTRGVSQPADGEKATERWTFDFDLDLQIPQLRSFLEAPLHVANIAAGTLHWNSKREVVNPGGTVVLYRTDEQDPAHKYFDFTFSFPDADGNVWTVEGHKYLHDDGALDPLEDLSTVFLVLHDASGKTAAGVTRVHINELVQQLVSLHVTGTGDVHEKAAAKEAFFGFMNDELHAVYRRMPRFLPKPQL